MSEGAIHYIILESSRVQLAVDFYIEVFQGQRIQNYPDGSVQLRIFNSSVLVTPGDPSNSPVLELLMDPNSLQMIRQDARFTRVQRSNLEKARARKKLRDPFGVCWLLTEYQFSDIYRHTDSCERCKQERHLPALCHEMNTWHSYIQNRNQHPDPLAEKAFLRYSELQEGMSAIRHLRFLHESADIVLFTNHPTLRAIFDELERINSFLQSLEVALYLNKTLIAVEGVSQWKRTVSLYARRVFGGISPPNPNFSVEKKLLLNRSQLADSFRQLVKCLQTARTVMNKTKFGISIDDPWYPTPEEKWMADILYKDVDYWRTQKYVGEN